MIDPNDDNFFAEMAEARDAGHRSAENGLPRAHNPYREDPVLA